MIAVFDPELNPIHRAAATFQTVVSGGRALRSGQVDSPKHQRPLCRGPAFSGGPQPEVSARKTASNVHRAARSRCPSITPTERFPYRFTQEITASIPARKRLSRLQTHRLRHISNTFPTPYSPRFLAKQASLTSRLLAASRLDLEANPPSRAASSG